MIVLLMTSLPAASAADRLVVAELFTAQNCPYCAYADPALGEVYGSNSGDIAVIAFHPLSYDGEADPMGLQPAEDRGARYGVEGFPTVVFDGVGRIVGGYEGVGDDYERELDDRLAVDSPLKLRMGLERSGSTLRVWMNGTPEEDVYNDTELSVVLVQDHVAFDGANGLDDFRFVARAVKTKDVDVLEGEPFSLRFSFTVNTWPDGLSVIGFVQDTGSGEIYQGAQKAVSDQADTTPDGADTGSGQEGLSATETGMIGLISVLVIVGVYVFTDDLRRKARSAVKVRKARPSSRRTAAKSTTKIQPARPKQRGKAGRSKKRKRHR